MDLFFNELSFAVRSFDRPEAMRRMDAVVEVIRKYAQHGGGGALRTLKNFLGYTLSDGYTVRHWLSDNSVRAEKRTRFKTAATKGPFVEEWLARQEEDGNIVYEFRFGTDLVFGLGAGFLFESPTVSLPGDPRFETDPVTILVSVLNEGGLKTEEKKVCSFTNSGQIAGRLEWMRKRIQQDIVDGSAAWNKHAELFPNLTFCESASDWLKSMTGKEPYFWQVCRHLFILNSFCVEWPMTGVGQLTAISWSDESDSTLNNKSLRSKREFNCPDGQRRLFRLHTKPTGGNIRIHFLLVPEECRIMIGYIGPHLPY